MLALVPVIVFLGGLSVGAYDEPNTTVSMNTIDETHVAFITSNQ